MLSKIDEAKIRKSDGTYEPDPVPFGANDENVMCFKDTQPLSEVLQNISSKFEVLESYLTRTKGLDGLDGRSIFICYKRLEEDADIVYSYEELQDTDGIYPSTYLMGIYLGNNIPKKSEEYSFIRMGGEIGKTGPEGPQGPRGEDGVAGEPFIIKGAIDCTNGLKLENIVISTEDVGNAYYIYEIEDKKEVTNLYLIGYPIEVNEDGTIKPIEENQEPEWLKIDSMKGESAYEIAKTTWTDGRTEDETNYEESLTAYGLWYWTRTEAERKEVLEDKTTETIAEPWYSDVNKKKWLNWNRGDSNYIQYKKENPDTAFDTEKKYLTSLNGDIISGLEMAVDKENKNLIKYSLKYKTYKSGEEKEESYSGECELSGESLFYLQNCPSIGINPTYSLIQSVGIEETTTANQNEIIGFNSVAFGKGNIIKSSKENSTIDDSKKIIANMAVGDSNIIYDAQGSAAAGVGLRVSGVGQIVVGQYNVADPDAQFIIGTGTNSNNRFNALVVKKSTLASTMSSKLIPGELVINSQVTAAAGLVSTEITTDKILPKSSSLVKIQGILGFYDTLEINRNEIFANNEAKNTNLIFKANNDIILKAGWKTSSEESKEYKFYANGDFSCSGEVEAESFFGTSDKRKKTNIKPYYPEESILDIEVKEFDFIESGSHSIGFIAQDLQEKFPLLVKKSKNGYLSINETKLVYLLINEVKKLENRVKELEENKE